MFAGNQILCSILLASVLGSESPDGLEATQANAPEILSPQLKALIEQTVSQDSHKRAEAVKRIGELREKGAPALPCLIRLFDDQVKDPAGVPYHYVDDALHSIGDPALQACLNLLASDAVSRIWLVHLCDCLGEFKTPRATEALLNLGKSPDAKKRKAAIVGLARCGEPRANLAVIEGLSDSNFEVRQMAVYGLKDDIRDSRSVEPLLKLLQNDVPLLQRWFQDNSQLRGEFIRALGNQRDTRASPALFEILRNPQEFDYNRRFAAISLGMIGETSAFPAFSEIAKDRNEARLARYGALDGISELRKKAGGDPVVAGQDALDVELLADLMNDTREELELRICAAEALGGTPAVEFLGQIVHSRRNDAIAYRAAICTVKITHGAIGDATIARVIRTYEHSGPGFGSLGMHERYNALQEIVERGLTPRVRHVAGGPAPPFLSDPNSAGVVAIIACLVCVSIGCYWKARKSKKPNVE